MPSGQSHSSDATVAIVVSAVVGGLLLTCVGCFLWRRKKKKGRGKITNLCSFSITLEHKSDISNVFFSPCFVQFC